MAAERFLAWGVFNRGEKRWSVDARCLGFPAALYSGACGVVRGENFTGHVLILASQRQGVPPPVLSSIAGQPQSHVDAPLFPPASVPWHGWFRLRPRYICPTRPAKPLPLRALLPQDTSQQNKLWPPTTRQHFGSKRWAQKWMILMHASASGYARHTKMSGSERSLWPETIAKDLPDFTVHDITHSDALWEYADLIAGKTYPLNPCEGFVLGCAFLIHDLGMGLAAYPEGLHGLKKRSLWRDTVADLLRQKGVELIDDSAINDADAEVERQAVSEALRLLHAERAEKLALIHWDSLDGEQRFYLIEDPELRSAFGPIIGRIAFSHWWSIDRVAKEFSSVMGAQAGFPHDWTVDPLKLSCMLRCADCAHIDERRAPAFLRALRKPEGDSDDHWKFQEKLYQPRIEADRLIFTAKCSFAIDEASAWWLCFDTLSSIDSELRKVDALLADTRRNRLDARGVSQVEEPSRIAKLIKTDGWQPVDTRIRVSAVADLVAKLGGKDLYGDNTTPPLREMVQNAADAVRARRLLDGRPASWGEIRICFGDDESGSWIQVDDCGVGMSEAVLTGPLLDFGTTFWSSALMHDQLPGLSAKGFTATGRYGIGFFSVFMWGEHVEVTTQRFDKGRDDTLVLLFKKGLKERPLLRRAQAAEHILDGGTRVKVWFSDIKTLDRIITTFGGERKLSFTQACARVAPCVDVTIRVGGDDGDFETAVEANDWLTISSQALLDRISPLERSDHAIRNASYFESAPCPPLQILKAIDGRIVGRVAIWNWEGFYSQNSKGIVVVGGFRCCRLAGIVGVLLGAPTRASRDLAEPVVSISVLRDWAANERDLRFAEGHSSEALESIAEVVSCIGVDTGQLPIARSEMGWVNAGDIFDITKGLDEVLLVQDASVSNAERNREAIQLNNGVFALDTGAMSLLNSDARTWHQWPPPDAHEEWGDRSFFSASIQSTVIRVISKAWNVSIEQLLEVSSFTNDRESFEREIGRFGDKPFVDTVNIIRRPEAVATAKSAHPAEAL
jgi:Histidine kinase-, DNA gyrase B-, and HSP90-like ATPase